jgi:hypothetical protein
MAKRLALGADVRTVAVYSGLDQKFHKGSIHGHDLTDEEMRGIRVFEIGFSNPEGTVDDKAPELSAALEAIARVTDKDVHLVAHSQGNEVAAAALIRRAKAGLRSIVESYVDIGGVNSGTLMGKFGALFGGIVGVKDAAKELEFGSPLIEEQKRDLGLIKSQIKGDVTNIVFDGAPTVASDGKIKPGDAFTSDDDSGIPGAPKVVLHNPDPSPVAHLVEPLVSGTIGETQKALVASEAHRRERERAVP